MIGETIVLSVAPDSPGSPSTPVLTSWEHVQDTQFLHFHLAGTLEAGARYVVSMHFSGTMLTASQAQGLYWDSYVNEIGERVYIAATQLESIFARKMYPGFDEPALKTTFDITVLRRGHFKSFANTPLVRTEPRDDGWFADVYERTPVMSSYLVCIVVGDFVEVYSGETDRYEVRVWARPQIVPLVQYAAAIATKVHEWLEETTQQAYPVSKMDHIALPTKGGAMENWGLITYGEESFCVNPETSPANQKLNVASIIAHELAHQWYGNLVTCYWWDDTWLNEGFATYYNYYPNSVLGWEASEIQQVDVRRGVMQYMDIDARNNSDPIRKDTPHVSLGPGAFSGSTYPKGGAMLRMISSILTEDTFNRGLQRYLDKMKYLGAVTDDLWDSLTEQAAEDGITNPDGSALDMKARMDPWFNQMGYPLVTFTRQAGGTATVSRSRFFNPRNQQAEIASPWNYAWDVPITVVTQQSSTADWDAPPAAWIDFDQTMTTLSGLPLDQNQWVMLNPKGRNYYRVHYDDASRWAIINAINTNPRSIESQSKSSFIDDTFALSRVGLVPETDAMETTRYLVDEHTYNPWYPAIKYFSTAERLVRSQPWFTTYRSYVLSLTVPIHSELDWVYYDEETPLQQYLRRDMLSLSCTYGYLPCVDKALQEYYVARGDTSVNSVDPNNLPTVLCTGVQLFSDDWEMWFNQYQYRMESPIREERYAYLFGLACSPPHMQTYLTQLISGGIASRDVNTAAGYMALTDTGALLLLNYLDQNWDTPAFSAKFSTMQTIVSGFNGETGLERLISFIDRHPPRTESERNLYAQMVLTVQQNLAWLRDNSDPLRDWLSARTPMNDEQLAARMHQPLPISPIHHWMHVMDTSDDAQLY